MSSDEIKTLNLQIDFLTERNAKLEKVFELAKIHVKNGGMVNAQRLAHALIDLEKPNA